MGVTRQTHSRCDDERLGGKSVFMARVPGERD